jgi:hypothetical protein
MKENCWKVALVVVHRVYYFHFIISLKKYDTVAKTFLYYAGQKILAVIVCQFKKKNCNPYFIVIMITVLIMNVIFWVVNFKTQNSDIYVRLL